MLKHNSRISTFAVRVVTGLIDEALDVQLLSAEFSEFEGQGEREPGRLTMVVDRLKCGWGNGTHSLSSGLIYRSGSTTSFCGESL